MLVSTYMRNEENFKCNICNVTFECKNEFMKHRKLKHIEMVQMCKNNDQCIFKNSCWFRHEEYDNQIIIENNEENENVIQKLVSIVETISKKVSKQEIMIKTLSDKINNRATDKLNDDI